VPYKGGAPAVMALVGGEVQLSFASITATLPMIQGKRLNGLAVSSAKRSEALPQVPTLAESGVAGFNVTNPFGLLAPSETPAAVVKLLNAEVRRIVQLDEVRAKFAVQGFEAVASTPAEFRAITEAEQAQWARVIRDAHITIN
jgi:tripartite-type tricarboxylate transporter receptor subunit TctC